MREQWIPGALLPNYQEHLGTRLCGHTTQKGGTGPDNKVWEVSPHFMLRIEQGQEIGQPYPYPYRMHMMSRYTSVKCAACDIIHWHDSTAVNRQL